MPPTSVEQVESALAAIIGSLARILIKLEITPTRLSQIARSSFVKAAAVQAKKPSSGRPHVAKIAALTGLSRTEVKRIVLKNFLIEKRGTECQPRALRVLMAWKTSPHYSKNGKPRRLTISGPGFSFESLCKNHSGDIPPKVILNELERNSRVALNKQRTTVSVVLVPKNKVPVSKELNALTFAASFISAALCEDYVLVRRKQKVLTSTSFPTPYVEQAISGRINEVLDHMPQLFPKSKGLNRNSVNVFALVARNPRATKNKR